VILVIIKEKKLKKKKEKGLVRESFDLPSDRRE
jgi:hypothetical protein